MAEAAGHLTRLDSIKARLLILDAWSEAIEEEITSSTYDIVRRLEAELKAENARE